MNPLNPEHQKESISDRLLRSKRVQIAGTYFAVVVILFGIVWRVNEQTRYDLEHPVPEPESNTEITPSCVISESVVSPDLPPVVDVELSEPSPISSQQIHVTTTDSPTISTYATDIHITHYGRTGHATASGIDPDEGLRIAREEMGLSGICAIGEGVVNGCYDAVKSGDYCIVVVMDGEAAGAYWCIDRSPQWGNVDIYIPDVEGYLFSYRSAVEVTE